MSVFNHATGVVKTAVPFDSVNGTAGTAAVGAVRYVTFGGTWTVGDKWTVLLTYTATDADVLLGAGDVTGIEPTYCMTFGDKMYVLADSKVLISCLTQPTMFNNPEGVGNDVITVTNYSSDLEPLLAVAPYQGKLAFFSRATIQIWQFGSLATDTQRLQILENVGTIAPASVRSVGDLDVFFLSETGIRSLRVRDSSNNAFSTDIGSPVDSLVAAAVAASANPEDAQSIVEPGTKRYWLFLDDTIYVLSYFPSNKVVAWSTYTPSYESAGVQTAFTPEKFVTYQGSVYCRDTAGHLIKYGGGYDNIEPECEIPWTHGGDSSQGKQATAVDASFKGSWVLYATMDLVGGREVVVWDGRNTRTPASNKDSTYDKGMLPFSAQGTHFKFRAVGKGSGAASFTSCTLHFDKI